MYVYSWSAPSPIKWGFCENPYPNVGESLPDLIPLEDLTPDALLVAADPLYGYVLLAIAQPGGGNGGVGEEEPHRDAVQERDDAHDDEEELPGRDPDRVLLQARRYAVCDGAADYLRHFGLIITWVYLERCVAYLLPLKVNQMPVRNGCSAVVYHRAVIRTKPTDQTS